MNIEFIGKLWFWKGPAPWYFVTVPAEQCRNLKAIAGVDSAFVFTFVQYPLPHRADPDDDLDMASYGIVKVYEDRFGETYPDMHWEPKAAFTTLADYYQTHAAR